MKKFNNARHFREFKGYSQKYVAKKLGKSQPALSRIENGSTRVSDDILDQLSKILEVPKGKLYSNEQLIFDYNANKELTPPLKDIAPTLLNQLLENKKLLLTVKSNQEQLQQQLDILLKAFNN